jgi:hypothetical protein
LDRIESARSGAAGAKDKPFRAAILKTGEKSDARQPGTRDAAGSRGGALTFDSLHAALGPDSARVKQFIVQRAHDTGEHDEVRIALGRVSDLEYRAICDKLRGLSCVTRFEEGNGLSGDE